MTALGVWLAALGASDLAFAPSGWPSRNAPPRAAAASALVAAALAIVFGLPAVDGAGIVVLAAASSFSWTAVRAQPKWSPRRAALATAAATLAVLGGTVAAGAWEEPGSSLLRRALDASPFPALYLVPAPRLALLLGCALVLCGTANAFVRLVLEAAETLPRARAEPPLRGGRVIGILERLLIFGFVIAGAPAAAALVASAKSVLRFPELNRAGTEIHTVTEYFLVGSLTSWLLALAFAVLAAA